MATEPYERPKINRLSIEIPEEDHKRLNELCPWGTKTKIFQAFVKVVITLLEDYGAEAIGVLLDRKEGSRFLHSVMQLKGKEEREHSGDAPRP